jgi:RNA polymerase sigma factor (sigma-70 family)
MPAARIPAPRPLRRQATLRAQAMRGDEAAFAELYRRNHQALYRYSLSLVRNPDDASDALQNSMTKAFAALQHESRNFEVVPWLFRIVHNESISLIRSRRPTVDIDRADRFGEDHLARSVEDRARLSQLQSDLAELGERQRGALVMRELSGLSHEEIGVALGCSTAAAKQAIFEARGALSEQVAGRAMQCEDVQRALSDADGRVIGSRRIRAHLRDCVICSSFRESIRSRPQDLAAITPALPAAGAAAILSHVLAGAQAGTAASATGTGAAGGLLAGGAVGKSIAIVAATAALAGGVVTAKRVTRHHTPSTPAKTTTAAPAVAVPSSGAAVGAAKHDRAARSHGRSAKHAHGRSGAASSGNGKALGHAKANSKSKAAAKSAGKRQHGRTKSTTKTTPPGQLKKTVTTEKPSNKP